jgi:hypothetical protein
VLEKTFNVLVESLPVFPEGMLSPSFDFCDTLHRLHRHLDKVTIISDRDISSFFEFERGILLKKNSEFSCNR